MRSLVVLIAVLFFIQCKSTSGDDFTNAELLVGTWTVSSASIDGTPYPVTNPGLLQVQAIFGETSFQYNYPQVVDGIPNGNVDVLTGTWTLNEDETVINIVPTGSTEAILVWNIDRLAVGTLEVTFQQQSMTGEGYSTYNLVYSLTGN